ncbi:MAG TPA: hypothetical protein DCS67_04345 [Clostridiales bacterium UBA8960]|jgi:rhamnose utilization protein RhaD (predicted bifunctional aldolase and dehydrogenase)|nr:hypothetical protein [Clostridiales bacterium UBA8960]
MHRSYNQIIDEFVELCHMFSDAIDMIQAGGGNASTKYIDSSKPVMLIKASGYLMSEVTKNNGFTAIDAFKVNQLLEDVKKGTIAIDDEHKINKRITSANLSTLRPSIETFLHAMIPVQHVLHIHDLITLLYVSTVDFEDEIKKQWDEDLGLSEMLLVPYEKPGIHLAMQMMKGLDLYEEKYGKLPKGILLQNHGFIVAHDDMFKIYENVVSIQDQIKAKIGLPMDFCKAYREGYEIKRALNKVFSDKSLFVRLSEDKDLNQYTVTKPSFPDALVFCGLTPLLIDSVDEMSLNEKLVAYKAAFDEFPKVVIKDDALYFCGESIKKCLEIQDVLKIQHILATKLGDRLKTLTEAQVFALLNWEAEKYRKNL